MDIKLQEDPMGGELTLLLLNKKSGYEYQKRRHDQWAENYSLYRDTVEINRLTQRQSVHLPLMKTMCQTNLASMDDMPVVSFENLDNDKQAEYFKNEYWKWTGEQNGFELQDIVDKKQEWLFGRTWDQWQVVDGKIKMTVEDPQDILVDRYCDPYNIHSSRFLIHNHIFVPLSKLEKNKDYDQGAVAELKMWHASQQGLIKNATNQQMLTEKNKKLSTLGVDDVESPILGEAIVELSLHFVFRAEGSDEEQIWLYVEADGQKILMKKKLEEVIGVTKDHFFRNHYPYVSWAGDVERQDFYSDGKGDSVRIQNKIVDSYYSQLVENRTLRNYNMHYFDSGLEGFNPQTFQPIPWGWYGIPLPAGSKLDDVFKAVEIPDLSESLDEINFVVQMVEKQTGATPTQQGVQTANKITLGEVELALNQAQERSKGISKFYTKAWTDRGLMFTKLVEAAADRLDMVKIYKSGKNTSDVYQREVAPKDFMTQSGYRCKVWSQDERNKQNTEQLQKVNAAKSVMPFNKKLNEVYQRKVLEFAGLTPEEINAIMTEEKQTQELGAMNGQGMMPTMPQQAPLPAPRGLTGAA